MDGAIPLLPVVFGHRYFTYALTRQPKSFIAVKELNLDLRAYAPGHRKGNKNFE